MTSSTTPCNLERLRRFVLEELPSDELDELESHLSECEDCRSALDRQIAEPQAWDDARSWHAEEIDAAAGSDAQDRIESYRALLGPTDDPRMLGRIGSHEIVGILGVGGMGVVFKGFDPTLNRYVAIKMLLPIYHASGVATQRFMREAQSAAAVLHENVIAIHSIDRWKDAPYLVMTYVRGESLRRRLSRRGVLSLREVLRIGMQVAAGLSAAHSQGLIHRDIKPANILLETDVDRVKISDFGLARAVDDIRLTKSETLIGTPQYMSPEQARDELLDYRTDLFSLGSVLYEACTGRAPFYASTSYGVLKRIVDHQPPPVRQLNPDMPDWLERIVARLMEKNREHRFRSAADVESVLRQCLAHVEQPLLAPLPEAVSPSRKQSARDFLHRWRVPMGFAALGLLAGLGATFFAQNGRLEREAAAPKSGNRAVVAAGPGADSPRPAADAPARAGDYTVEILGVADVSGMTMTTEFDVSRIKMDPQAQSFGNASAGGFAGGAGGGFAGNFLKPNFGIALKIEPVNAKRTKNEFVKLATKAKAIDDQGNEIESKDLGPVINHFAEFESQYPGAGFVYFHHDAAETPKIVKLEGDLLVVPGRKLSVAFEGVKPQTRESGKDKFRLEAVTTNDEGTQVRVKFPPLKSVDNAKSPQEKFQAMLANRGSYSALIEDSEGDLQSFQGAMNSGGNGQSSFSFNGQSGGGFATSGDASQQTFKFGPLPEGRTIKTIRVGLEERTGETKPLPFVVEAKPAE